MASTFHFNDLLPVGGEFKVRALDFLGRNIPLYGHQRLESPDRVKEIVAEQTKYGTLFFATPLIIVHVDGVHMLCDGQHRVAALRQLQHHADMRLFEIRVLVHLCGIDKNLAERVYLQSNNQYMINGSIDRTTNQLYRRDIATMSRQVVENIKQRFPKQIGARFPNFDPNALETELNTSNLLERKSVEEVTTMILRENTAYEAVLSKLDSRKYFQCREKNSFYLPAKEAGCRWLRQIAHPY